jgi:DNA-binding MarR family transcriptional regulator
MSLEKDISQQHFRNEHQKAVINLIYTFNWMNEKLNRHFDPYEITQQQFNILRILRGAGRPLSTLQIRQRMLDKMSDSSRIVGRLIIKGLVKKAISLEDRRLVDVELTEKGSTLLQQMDGLNEAFDSVVKNLSQEDARQINELLDKIRNTD